MTVYLISFALLCFVIIPYLVYKWSGDEQLGFFFILIGLLFFVFGCAIGDHITNKVVGYQIIDPKNIITEKGDYSCTFHVKDVNGVVTNTIRIDKALEIESFKKGDYYIGRSIHENIWLGKYTSDVLTFVSTKTEK